MQNLASLMRWDQFKVCFSMDNDTRNLCTKIRKPSKIKSWHFSKRRFPTSFWAHKSSHFHIIPKFYFLKWKKFLFETKNSKSGLVTVSRWLKGIVLWHLSWSQRCEEKSQTFQRYVMGLTRTRVTQTCLVVKTIL